MLKYFSSPVKMANLTCFFQDQKTWLNTASTSQLKFSINPLYFTACRSVINLFFHGFSYYGETVVRTLFCCYVRMLRTTHALCIHSLSWHRGQVAITLHSCFKKKTSLTCNANIFDIWPWLCKDVTAKHLYNLASYKLQTTPLSSYTILYYHEPGILAVALAISSLLASFIYWVAFYTCNTSNDNFSPLNV